MRLKNATPKGPTVFITDLKVRIGLDSVLVNVRDAIQSNDLRSALDQGMIQLEVTDAEKIDPRIGELLTFAQFADAKREGKLLFAQAESALMSKQPVDSPNVPIRPAVFVNVL